MKNYSLDFTKSQRAESFWGGSLTEQRAWTNRTYQGLSEIYKAPDQGTDIKEVWSHWSI
jgi:hypothetical protein